MSKIIFMKYLPPARLKLFSKLKTAQNLLEFSTSNISSVSVTFLMSKIIFMKF